MESYSVTQVESLTGIKAHTLRVWERRYGFVLPMRTDTNIRYYSEAQLRKLLNVSVLIDCGVRISKIVKMTDGELFEQVNLQVEDPSIDYGEGVNALVLAMLDMNETAFNKVFRASVLRKGLKSTMVDLIYPFLKRVGILWTSGKAVPAHEHYISNLIRQKIIASIDMLPDARGDAPTIILFLPEGEEHEIGLLLGAFIAKDRGWNVIYLGQNVPTENLFMVVDIVKPKALLTMLVASYSSRSVKAVNEIVKTLKTPILLSGNVISEEDLLNFKHVKYIQNPQELEDYLIRGLDVSM
ncbi:MerR family transcriptional regulator [Puteibacter caeruleilacunae]|nr:MerR family transcriptional regulator [Puteibacter caeruleilacunae]